MQNQILELIEEIKADYLGWTSRNHTKELTDINRNMIKQFNEGITYKEGKKYTKVMTQNSVWGFVMQEDDAKFKAGDILMAAGYNAPARNKARGNVFKGYNINWTGPNYLK
tara:strand:- start:165 stop:497 length:333 start_codon:yes stop_codon:yes gene_type:complete